MHFRHFTLFNIPLLRQSSSTVFAFQLMLNRRRLTATYKESQRLSGSLYIMQDCYTAKKIDQEQNRKRAKQIKNKEQLFNNVYNCRNYVHVDMHVCVFKSLRFN